MVSTVVQKKGRVDQYSAQEYAYVYPETFFEPTKDPNVILYKSLANFV